MWREAEADGGQYRGPPTRGLTSEDEAKLQIFSDLMVFFFLFHFFLFTNVMTQKQSYPKPDISMTAI